jgi:hypothetical protein
VTRFRRKTYNRPAPPPNTYAEITLQKHRAKAGGVFAFQQSIAGLHGASIGGSGYPVRFVVSGVHAAPVWHRLRGKGNLYRTHGVGVDIHRNASQNVNSVQGVKSGLISVPSQSVKPSVHGSLVTQNSVASQNLATLHAVSTPTQIGDRDDWPTLQWQDETWESFTWGEGLINWEPNS